MPVQVRLWGPYRLLKALYIWAFIISKSKIAIVKILIAFFHELFVASKSF